MLRYESRPGLDTSPMAEDNRGERRVAPKDDGGVGGREDEVAGGTTVDETSRGGKLGTRTPMPPSGHSRRVSSGERCGDRPVLFRREQSTFFRTHVILIYSNIMDGHISSVVFSLSTSQDKIPSPRRRCRIRKTRGPRRPSPAKRNACRLAICRSRPIRLAAAIPGCCRSSRSSSMDTPRGSADTAITYRRIIGEGITFGSPRNRRQITSSICICGSVPA